MTWKKIATALSLASACPLVCIQTGQAQTGQAQTGQAQIGQAQTGQTPAPAGYPQRSVGASDAKANLVLDARPDGIRVLPPVLLYPKGNPDFADWPGKMDGAEEIERDGTLFNVKNPSFQAFLPAANRNTRTAVIIAPGGGFRQLSINSEGNDVAQWLAARGIASFVLKYRIVEQKGANPSMVARMGEFGFDVAGAPGVADGIEAIRQIRARAAEYGVDPQRVVFIGFSAGAHVTAHQALNRNVAARPNYAAPIYGGPLESMPEIPPPYLPGTVPAAAPASMFALPQKGTPNPAALPPMFIAGSQDDFLVGKQTRRFYDALVAAGYNPEGHFFANGLHGYGLNETNSSSRHFIEEFYWWLETQGLTRKPGDADRKLVPVDLSKLMRGPNP